MRTTILIMTLLATVAVQAQMDCFQYEDTNRWLEPLTLDAPVVAVAGADGLLVCATADELVLLDVDPAVAPVELGRVSLSGPVSSLVLAGSLIIAADLDAGLQVYDASDPRHPIWRDEVVLPTSVRDLQAGPHWLAAVGDDAVVYIMRLDGDQTPALGWTFTAAGDAYGAACWQDRLVLAGDMDLSIVTVPEPGAAGDPEVERTVNAAPEFCWGAAADAVVRGDRALVAFEWWVPVEPAAEGRELWGDINLLTLVDLAAAPGALPLASLETHQAAVPSLAATSSVLASVGEGLMLLGDRALNPSGHWLRPELSFPCDEDTRLAAAGEVLVRLDAGQVRLLDSDPLVAPTMLGEERGKRGWGVGDWFMTSNQASPGQWEYGQSLWYAGDPLAPALVDSFDYVFSFEFGQGGRLISAQENVALVGHETPGGAVDYYLYEHLAGGAVKTPISLPSGQAQLDGTRLVVEDDNRLDLWDVTDPAAPVRAGEINYVGGYIVRFVIGGDRLVIDSFNERLLIDITDLTSPQLLAMGPSSGYTRAVTQDLVMEVVDGDVRIFDHDLQLLGQVTGSGNAVIRPAGDLMYVGWRNEGLDLVDISDPTQPTRLGVTVSLGGDYLDSLALGDETEAGRIVYAGLSYGGLQTMLIGPDAPGQVLGRAGGYSTQLRVTESGLLRNGTLLPLQCADITAAEPAPMALSTRVLAAPNPFNPTTQIRFDVPMHGAVTLDVHDLRGRRISRLVESELPAGRHTRIWDGTDQQGRTVATGVYLLRVTSAAGVASGRVALIK